MTPHIESLPLFPACICGDSACVIPFGFCHCGCGKKVSTAKNSSVRDGATKGLPRRYISGHNGKIYLTLTGTCVCRKDDCAIGFGLCHCGCGEVTKISDRTELSSFRIINQPMRFVKGHQGRIRPTIEDAVPFKIDGVYCRLIPLTRGQYAIVDAIDYEWLMRYHWYARWNPGMRSFYASRKDIINGKDVTIQMHRQILGLNVGDPRKGDHKESGQTLDNRRANLRIATHAENSQNQRIRRTNRYGATGITLFKRTGQWMAFVRVNGKQTHLGYFKTKEEAIAARVAAARESYGEFCSQ